MNHATEFPPLRWFAQPVVGTHGRSFQIITENGGLICYVEGAATAARICREHNAHDTLVNAVVFAIECAEVPVFDPAERRKKGEKLMRTLREAFTKATNP